MKNNDALKKYHFWILCGLVPLLVLIAVVMVISSVGGAISERRAKIEKAQKEIASKSNPKPKKLLEKMDELIARVDSKRGDLWKANWESQKDLFVWPRNRNFANFARLVKKTVVKDGQEQQEEVLEPVRLEDLKFGDPIPNNADQYAAFKSPDLYLAMYSNADPKLGRTGTGIADIIAPTQFFGGWRAVLRHVTQFPERQLTSEQIWLLMEDYWVQRGLILALKSVNDHHALFQPVRLEKDGVVIDDPADPKLPQNPLHRKFRSPTWELTLKVEQQGNRRYLTGTLANITDRVQILGANRVMTLKVWLDANADGSTTEIEPVEFRIGGEYVPGRGAKRLIRDVTGKGKDIEVPADTITIAPDPNDKELKKYPNIIPPGINVTRIARVEQVFDPVTVPVRRIDALALGYTDSRWAMKTKLLMPKFPAFEKIEEQSASSATAGMSSPMGSMIPTGPPGGGSDMPGEGEYPGLPGAGGTRQARQGIYSGGGTLEQVVDGNRRRYVDVTDQVRRMPVALAVIVDQAHMQDVLLALANSPLRFQITQVTWQRFRGKLDTGSGGSGSLAGGDMILTSGPGQFGEGFGIGPGDDPYAPPGYGSGSGFGPPMPPGMPAVPPAGPPAGYAGSGGYNPYGPTVPGSGGVLSEAQLTSGLIELTVYGLVSLYEKYTPPAAANPVAASGTSPGSGDKGSSPSDVPQSPPHNPTDNPPQTPSGNAPVPGEPKQTPPPPPQTPAEKQSNQPGPPVPGGQPPAPSGMGNGSQPRRRVLRPSRPRRPDGGMPDERYRR